MNVQTTMPATADLDAIKARQQVACGSGDYALIGTALQIVGEMLCEAVDLRSTQRVLDVAAGNGNASLPQHAVLPRWYRPTMSGRCSCAAANAPRPNASP